MRRTVIICFGAPLCLLGLASAHRPTLHLAAIGDSTVAEYPTPDYPAVASFLKGIVGTTLAVPGQTIAQQEEAWLNFPGKTGFDIIVVQVGLNDMSPAVPAEQTLGEFQHLLDAINQTKRPSAVTAIAQLDPAGRRWTDLYGLNNARALAKWKSLNRSIAGHGPVPIVGADVRIGAHVAALSTSESALRREFDGLGDGIHPNARARRIVACAWADALQRAGLYVTC